MKKVPLILACFLISLSTSFAQQVKSYTIGMLSDSYSPDMEPLAKQLQEQIIAVVGPEAGIKFEDRYMLSSEMDVVTAESNYNAFIQNPDIDIILAFGPINNYVIAQKKVYSKPVVLFGILNQDFISLPGKQETSGIPNLTYLITPESFKNDLETFRNIYPYSKVGIILEEHLTSLYPVKENLDKDFESIDAGYVLIPFENVEQLDAELEKVDAVYLTGGMHMEEEKLEKIITLINNKKLPSFSALGRERRESGILLTHSSEYQMQHFFRRIALTVESIIHGTNPGDIPILIDYGKKLTLNVETALKIDFPLRYSQLLMMDVVGDLKNFPSEKRYSLPDVISRVLDKNFSLQAEKKNIDIARKDLRLAQSNYLPNLTSSAQGTFIDPEVAKISNGSNPEFSTSGNITLEQVIYSEDASGNIAIRKNLSKATDENFNAAVLDAVLDGSVAYFNTLIAKTNFIIQDENFRVTQRNYEFAEQNFSAGQTGKADVLRWKSEMAQATQDVVTAQNSLHQAFHALNEILSNPINYSIDVEDASLDEGVFEQYDYEKVFKVIDDPILRKRFVKFLVTEAKQNAPELKALDYSIQASERTAALYMRSKFLPAIALQGQYNHTFSRDGEGTAYPAGIASPPDGTYNVGVSLSLPIFQRNQRSFNRQRSILQQEQLKLQKESVELALERNVNDIIHSLVNNITNIEFSKISAGAARESLDLTQTAYFSGAVSITSLIDAQRAYIQSQQLQANASYNYLLNFLQLERIIGYFFMLHTPEENLNFERRFMQFRLQKEATQN